VPEANFFAIWTLAQYPEILSKVSHHWKAAAIITPPPNAIDV